MQKIILLLRGHIRNSFKDNKLFNFVKYLSKNYNLKIYIHTWNVFSSSLSWRPIELNNNNITKTDIMIYFSSINDNIISITIDDDNCIKLIGDTNGNIFSTKLPKLAWKRMWYGIFKTIEIIKENESEDSFVINTRFDIFNNSNSFDDNNILLFIESIVNKKITKNEFINDSEKLVGIDNFYMGNIDTMYLLIKEFYSNLDDINNKYIDIHFQEVVVFYENNRLFLNNDEDIYENINLYKIQNQPSIKDESTTKNEPTIKDKSTTKYQQFIQIKPTIKYQPIQPSIQDKPSIQEEPYNKSEILKPTNVLKDSLKKLNHTTTSWGSFGKNKK